MKMKEKLLQAWDKFYNSLDKNWKYAYKDVGNVLDDYLDEAIEDAENEYGGQDNNFKVDHIAIYLGEIISDYYFENNYNLANILTYYFANDSDLEPLKEHMEEDVWDQLYDYGEAHLYDVNDGSMPIPFTKEEEELMEEIFYSINYFSNTFFLEYFIRRNDRNDVGSLVDNSLTFANEFYYLLLRAFEKGL